MSNLDRTPSLTHSGESEVAARPVLERFEGRAVRLGQSTEVRRLLPNLGRRLVGPWCFVDHYGPDDIATQPGMQVPPHPHIGLQTVSWLRAGEVRHRDSLGNDMTIRPGELGLMTSGAGIVHAEYSPVPHPVMLHGAQLWVALPLDAAATAPGWEHHANLPKLTADGIEITVFLGELSDERSPGTTFSDLAGASIRIAGGRRDVIALEPDFEYAALVLSGSVTIEGAPLTVGTMLYLGTGRASLHFTSETGAEFLLLGGAPFGEQIVMWWNFVARSDDEIVAARDRWGEGGFGAVAGAGEPLKAPPLPPGRLRPGGATR
ncbi:MAG TPA: pirin family protein [Jatrophihabitans sp.]